jgi:hypothetical protein
VVKKWPSGPRRPPGGVIIGSEAGICINARHQFAEDIMNRAEFRLRLLLLVLTLAAGACSTKKSQAPAPPSDQAITSDIQAKLLQDPVLKTRDITVSVQGGVVTLTGTVNSDDEKSSVERTANQESGVKQVADQLTVATAAAAPPPQTASAPATTRPSRKKRHHAEQAAAPPALAPPAADSTEAQNTPPVPAPVPAPVIDQPPPQASATPPPPTATIPAGTTVTVRMIDSVDSSVSEPGQEFDASLVTPLVVGNQVVVPAGSNARVRLVTATSSGRFEGSAQVALELHSITINGSAHSVRTSTYQQSGGSRGRGTAEKVGAGAVIGGLIGALAGGGKGAAIGAGVGGAGGGGVQAASKRSQVKVPSETKIDFVLKAPITVTLQ